MSKADLYLGLGGDGGLTLLTPFDRTYHISDLEQARKGRTASGRLVKDIVYNKKQFSLAYKTIDDSELQKFIDLYVLKLPLTFRDARWSGYTDYSVLMDPLDYERIIAAVDGTWGNVQITLYEI